jgi:hypothetical protein
LRLSRPGLQVTKRTTAKVQARRSSCKTFIKVGWLLWGD